MSVTTKSIPQIPFTAGNITVAYTQADQHPESIVITALNTASKSIALSVFSLTKDSIVQSIIAAHQRGVNVRVITDATEYANSPAQTKAVDTIKGAGIPVMVDNHSGLMHLKTTVVDGSIVLEGSYNYTNQASTLNDESIYVINHPGLAGFCLAQFERMWNDTTNFKTI